MAQHSLKAAAAALLLLLACTACHGARTLQQTAGIIRRPIQSLVRQPDPSSPIPFGGPGPADGPDPSAGPDPNGPPGPEYGPGPNGDGNAKGIKTPGEVLGVMVRDIIRGIKSGSERGNPPSESGDYSGSDGSGGSNEDSSSGSSEDASSSDSADNKRASSKKGGKVQTRQTGAVDGINPILNFDFVPEWTVTPDIELTPLDLAPTLSLGYKPLDLTVGSSYGVSGAYSPQGTLTSTLGFTAPAAAATFAAPGVSLNVEGGERSKTVQGGWSTTTIQAGEEKAEVAKSDGPAAGPAPGANEAAQAFASALSKIAG